MTIKNIIVEDYHGEADPTILVPKTGYSYKNIAELREVVDYLELWQYKTALEILDQLIEQNVKVIDSLLLKGEIYALYECNHDAIDVYEMILQLEPENIYALIMMIGQLMIVGEKKEQKDHYFFQLKQISLNLYNKLKKIITFIESHKKRYTFPEIDQPLDLICVFGFFLEKDGSFPDRLLERLETTIHLSKEHPHATILISGGAVQNKYKEAYEMKRYLVQAGIKEERLIAYDKAKDTVGNVLEFMDYIKGKTIQNICAVTSLEHLPRAWMALSVGLEQIGYKGNVFAQAPKSFFDFNVSKKEMDLNYQTILRVAGLFDKEAIKNQILHEKGIQTQKQLE